MNTKKYTEIEQIIDFLWEISLHGALLVKLEELAEQWKNDMPKFKSLLEEAKAKTKVLSTAIEENMKVPLAGDKLEKLVWMILMLPLVGVEHIKGVTRVFKFGELKLRPILNAYVIIFSRLLAEYEIRCSVLKNKGLILKMFKDIVLKVEDENKADKEIDTGVFGFYKEIQEHIYFHNVALGVVAYFNKKIISGCDNEFRRRKKLKDKLDKMSEKNSTETKEMKKMTHDIKEIEARFSRFPPYWEILSEPMIVIKYGLTGLEESELEIEEWTPEVFRHHLERHSHEVGNQTITIKRKLNDFKVFLEATAAHKTIWGASDILHDESVRDISEGSGISEDIVCGLLGEELDVEKKITERDYRYKIIIENVTANQRRGGATWLRYCVDNRRAISKDRLCAFIGYLDAQQKNADVCRFLKALFIESLLTGVSITKILEQDKPHDENVKGRPIGLYLKCNELFGPSGNDASELNKSFRRVLNEFNKKHPGFAFRFEQITYTARSTLIDSLKLTPFEAAHVCGTTLTGMRSSLYYIKPRRLVEKLSEANGKFIDGMVSFIKNSRPRGFIKKEFALIETSLNCWIEAGKSLKRWSKIRSKKWNNRADDVRVLGKNAFNKIYDILEAKFKKNAACGDIKNEIICIESIVLYFILSLLMLRPAELKRISYGHISFMTRCLLITGKENKVYKESRCLPLPQSLMEILEKYRKYMTMERFAEHLGKNQPSQFFRYKDNAITLLLMSLIETQPGESLNIFRRTGGTNLYYDCLKNRPFEYWQAIMGHSQVGFEHWGPFSRMQFQKLREMIERHSKSKVFSNLIERFNKLP